MRKNCFQQNNDVYYILYTIWGCEYLIHDKHRRDQSNSFWGLKTPLNEILFCICILIQKTLVIPKTIIKLLYYLKIKKKCPFPENFLMLFFSWFKLYHGLLCIDM